MSPLLRSARISSMPAATERVALYPSSASTLVKAQAVIARILALVHVTNANIAKSFLQQLDDVELR